MVKLDLGGLCSSARCAARVAPPAKARAVAGVTPLAALRSRRPHRSMLSRRAPLIARARVVDVVSFCLDSARNPGNPGPPTAFLPSWPDRLWESPWRRPARGSTFWWK